MVASVRTPPNRRTHDVELLRYVTNTENGNVGEDVSHLRNKKGAVLFSAPFHNTIISQQNLYFRLLSSTVPT